MSAFFDIDANQVIRWIEQFLRENELLRTLNVLQEETLVKLNSIDDKEQLKKDIVDGRWDKVLKQLALLDLSHDVLVPIYEEMYLDLCILGENSVAKLLELHDSPHF
jgi:WD40 repeat-containing protein SMU1